VEPQGRRFVCGEQEKVKFPTLIENESRRKLQYLRIRTDTSQGLPPMQTENLKRVCREWPRGGQRTRRELNEWQPEVPAIIDLIESMALVGTWYSPNASK